MIRFVLFSDLDRTIIPNGAQVESPEARPKLRRLAEHAEMGLVYVSGRDLKLLQQAVTQYALPLPNFAVGDVGTTIYTIKNQHWAMLPEWHELIAPDWNNAKPADLVDLFQDLDILRLQEAEKQGSYKLSYYTPVRFDLTDVLAEMNARLLKNNICAALVWSVDEAANVGLLDVLPESATKKHAIEFLVEYMGLKRDACVFVGDSGNDLPVICDGSLQSVLVKNAHADVITEATEVLRKKDSLAYLYVAKGGFQGMNGNYSAGVLEGLAHYLPEVEGWM